MPAPPIPADPQTRLIYAAKMIAADLTQVILERKNANIAAGMHVSLGRVYEAVTGQRMSEAGPRKILQWAIDLDKSERIIVT